MLRKILSGFLAVMMLITMIIPAAAAADKENSVVSSSTELGSGESNRDYYTQEEWAEQFPNGTFIVENSEYTVTEGGDDPDNPTDTYLGIKIARMGGNSSKVNVTFAVNAVTGSEEDFAVENDTLVFQPGDTEQTAYIRIPDNNKHDNDRLLTFTLVDAEDAHLGKLITAMIRIADDEPYIATEVQMTAEPAVDKSTGAATVTLTRPEEQASYLFTVDLQTVDGTAKAGADYTAVNTTVVFKEGELTKQVGIPLLQSGDNEVHPSTALSVELSNPKGGGVANDKATIILTDQSSDPANPVHNTEIMTAEMGGNDQTDEIVLEEDDVTQNGGAIVGLNENAETADRKILLSNAFAAFSGEAMIQPKDTPAFWGADDTVWTSADRTNHPFSGAFAYRSSSDFDSKSTKNIMGDGNFSNNGIIGQSNVDVLMFSRDLYDMNLYQGLMVKWRNQTLSGPAFYPNTYIGLMYGGPKYGLGVNSSIWPEASYITYVKKINNADGTTTEQKIISNLAFDLGGDKDDGKWKYGFGILQDMYDSNYYLSSENDPENSKYNNTQATQYWFNNYTDATFQSSLFSGEKSENMNIFFSLANTSASEYNNFKVDEVKLQRAFIPFSRISHRSSGANSGLSYDAATGVVSFYIGTDADTYKMTMSVIAGSGGIKKGTNNDDSGIYIGSQVNISAKALSGSKAITKTQLVLNNQGGWNILAVSKDLKAQDDGSFKTNAPVTLKVTGAANGSTALDSRIMYNSKIVIYPECIALDYRDIALQYAAVKDNSSIKAKLSDVVIPKNASGTAVEDLGLLSVGDVSASSIYNLGSFAFDHVTVNPSVLGEGIKLTSNIAGYELIEKATDIPFDKFPIGKAIFTVRDYSKDYTTPNAVVTARSISMKNNSTWSERMTISSFTKSILFEEMHPVVGNTSRADALTFDLLISNSKNAETKISKTFPIEIYATDSDENQQIELFSFKHDTALEKPTLSESGTLNKSVDLDKVDLSYYPDKNGENGYPQVTLLSANANGMTYRIYIPSYYDYMNQTAGVRTVFSGGRSAEFHFYDNQTSKDVEPKILQNLQELLVQPKTPNDSLQSSQQETETPVQDGQDNFYVYDKDNAGLSLPQLDFDLSSITALIPKVGGATTPGLSIDGDQLTISMDFSGNPLEDDAAPSGGTAAPSSTGGGDTITQKMKTLKNAVSKMKAKDKAGLFNAAKNTYPKAGADVDFQVNGGISISLEYDSIMGRWNFGEAVFYLGTSLEVSTTQPFPTLPIFYYSLGMTVGAQVGTGFKSLPVGVSASGQVNRQIFWSGVSLSPSVYLSAGVGVGIADLVCASLTAYIDSGFTAVFGESNITMGSNTLDLQAGTEGISVSDDDWTNLMRTDKVPSEEPEKYKNVGSSEAYVLNSYKATLLSTDQTDASMIIKLNAKNFDLYGMLHEKGAVMHITVKDEGQNVLANKYIDTAYSKDLSGVKLFSYSGSSLQNLIVTITMDDRPNAQNDGKSLILDHLAYKIMDVAYTYTTTAASIPEWHVKIGIKFDAKFLIFSYSLDLIYFQVNESGTSWGAPDGNHEIQSFDATASTDAKQRKFNSSAGSDGSSSSIGLTERYVDFSGRIRSFNSNGSNENYFNLGDYTANKTVTKIDGAVDAASSSQLIQYNGKSYIFWVDDAGTQLRPDSLQRLALMYREVGSDIIHYVDDDGTSDFDFKVFENSAGELQAVWTNFHKGTVLPETTDMTTLMRAYNDSMEIKTAVMKTDGEFSTSVCLDGTSDGQNDSTLGTASNGNIDVFSYVKDVKGKYAADVKNNGQVFFDKSVEENSQAFTNSIYQGISTNYITVKKSDGTYSTMQVPTGLREAFWKVGTKITSSSLSFLNENTLALAFAAEIPNAQKGQYLGVDKALFVQYGQVGANGDITFADAKMVYEVFDYDISVNEIFAEDEIPSEYLYNGTLYDDPALAQVQFEQTNLPAAEEKVDTTELTLFFKLNDQIRYFNEDTLLSVGGYNDSKKVMKTIDLSVTDYTLQAAPDGTLYLIYERAQEGNYDSMVRVKTFSGGLWSEERTLTVSTAFDQLLFDNQKPTGAASFSQLSSLIDDSGNMLVLMQAAYRPFNYDGYVLDENNNRVVVPYLDESLSAGAKRELYLMKFEQLDAQVVGGMPELSSTLLKDGYTVDISVGLNNVGDITVENLKLEILADETVIATEQMNGSFVSGATKSVTVPYTVEAGQINNGSVIHYRLYTDNELLYESKTDTSYLLNSEKTVKGSEVNTVTISTDKSELYLKETDIKVDEQNNVTYSGILLNDGFAKLTKNPIVKVEVMKFDEELQYYVPDTSLGSNGVIASADVDMAAVDNYATYGLYYNFISSFAMPDYLKSDTFVLRLRVDYGEITENNEYDKENNYSRNFTLYPASDIVIGYENQENIVNVEIGDVLELNNLKVLSTMDGIDREHLSIREIGTNCLSIDNVSETPRIKVMSADAQKGTTVVRVAFSIDGTAISQSLLLNISRSRTINLTGNGTNDGVQYSGGWSYIKGDNGNPIGGYKNDVIQSKGTDESIIALEVSNAENFEIYGTKSINGGKFSVLIYDANKPTAIPKVIQVDTSNETSASELQLVTEKLDRTNIYIIAINVPSGEFVTLDTLVIDGLLGDLPETEAYNLPKTSESDLGLPIVDGRNRKATVKLNFASAVKLAENVDTSNLFLSFTVSETDSSGKTTDIGKQHLYFEQLTDGGKTAVFSADNLSSRAGTVRHYKLDDTELASGYFESVNGSTILLNIPNPDMIAFDLSESRISKVTVVDDQTAASGTVHKALEVTFQKQMDKERLDGTSILYKNSLVFNFSELSQDGLTATYRAELTLSDSETEKTFAFDSGIQLRESYALISSDGNFVDGTISASGQTLDIIYSRTKVTSSYFERRISSDAAALGEQIALCLRFDAPVTAENLPADSASLTVLQTIKTASGETVNEITLKRDTLSADRKTLTFISDMLDPYSPGNEITYTVKSAAIDYSGAERICNENDGIAVNPALTNSPELSFNTSASITGAALTMNGGFSTTELKPMAEVLFDTTVDEGSLKGTTIKIKELAAKADGTETETDRTLTFERIDTVTQNGKAVNKAVYSYQDSQAPLIWNDGTVKLYYFFTPNTSILNAGGSPAADILNYDRNIAISPQLTNAVMQNTEYDRSYIAAADLTQAPLEKLTENGSNLILKVTFNKELTQPELNGLTVTLTKKEANKADSKVQLSATQYDANTKTLTLMGTDSIYTSGVPVTYSLSGKINASAQTPKDENAVSADLLLPNELSLELKNEQGKISASAFDFSAITEAQGIPVLSISYDTKVQPDSFKNSTVQVLGKAEMLDTSINPKDETLQFAYSGASEDGTTVYYAYSAPLGSTAVKYSYSVGGNIQHTEPLLTSDRTMAISDILSLETTGEYERPLIESVALINRSPNTSTLVMNTTEIAVAFTKPLTELTNAELGNISLNIELTAILNDGTRKTVALTYSGKAMQDEKTLLFGTDSEEQLKNVRDISFKVQSLELEQSNGNLLFDKANNQIDANAEFLADTALSYKDETQGLPVPEDSKPSDEKETNPSGEQNTEVPDEKSENSPVTGNESSFKPILIAIFGVITGAAIIIIIVYRKKKDKAIT